jgi:hypothetical protein
MREPFTFRVTWATAFAIVASLYAPAVLGTSSRITTPVFAVVIACGLTILAVLQFSWRPVSPTMTPVRLLSATCLALAILGFMLSSVEGRFDREYNLNDWGLLALQAGTPLLILCNNRRLQLLDALGCICVGFAYVDMVANLWAALHGAWERDPGISGNTHAAGLVAFVGVAFLAAQEKRWWSWPQIALLFASLCLIDARRYLGMAIIAVPLLSFRPLAKLPLVVVTVAVAAVGLLGTFSTGLLRFGDDLRGDLMQAGLVDALAHPLLGTGPAWRDTSELQATFHSLSGAGVTESGLLDLSIAYGVPAALLLVLSAVLALCVSRSRLTLAPVVLTMLTAELAFGDSLTGFLGAVVFYTALAVSQRDDGR